MWFTYNDIIIMTIRANPIPNPIPNKNEAVLFYC
jgi:hypothetical protein